MRLLGDFSKESLPARRDWQEIFKVMKNKDLTAKIALPSRALNYNGK